MGYNYVKSNFEGGMEMANVKVYSSNTCPHCVTAKKYLNDKGIEFEERNVQTDPEARKELMAMGHMGVPVIVVDGEEIVGFNQEKIDNLLVK